MRNETTDGWGTKPWKLIQAIGLLAFMVGVVGLFASSGPGAYAASWWGVRLGLPAWIVGRVGEWWVGD